MFAAMFEVGPSILARGCATAFFVLGRLVLDGVVEVELESTFSEFLTSVKVCRSSEHSLRKEVHGHVQ